MAFYNGKFEDKRAKWAERQRQFEMDSGGAIEDVVKSAEKAFRKESDSSSSTLAETVSEGDNNSVKGWENLGAEDEKDEEQQQKQQTPNRTQFRPSRRFVWYDDSDASFISGLTGKALSIGSGSRVMDAGSEEKYPIKDSSERHNGSGENVGPSGPCAFLCCLCCGRMCRSVWMVVVMLLLAGMAVILAREYIHKYYQEYFPEEDGAPQESQPGFGSHPVIPPRDSEGLSERYLNLRDVVVTSNLTSVDEIDDRDSAQNRALTWLADLDPAEIQPHDEALLERYALGVFYFTAELSADRQATSDFWMSERSVCEWGGVQCVEPPPLEGQTDAGPNERMLRSRKILSVSSKVAVLNVTRRSLKGYLPKELVALQRLRALDLSYNELGGALPPEYGNMTQLEQLRLNDNQLVGGIPQSYGEMKELKYLALQSNKLDGSLTESISKLTNLTYLNVRDNNLVGVVSPSFGNLVWLETFYLYDNNILDKMPATVCDLRETTLDTLVADCGGNHPKMECSCCSTCVP